MKKITRLVFIALCSLLATPMVQAKVKKVKSRRLFNRALARAELAVVLFYARDKYTRKDKELNNRIQRLKDMFAATSETYDFQEGGLRFIRVNVARKDTQSIADRFGIEVRPEQPVFLLFDEGKQVTQEQSKTEKEKKRVVGQPTMLTGFVSRKQLSSFIREHVSEQLEDIADEREKMRKRAVQEARIRWYNRPYYYYYGWPYYSYGWPYYGFGYYGGYW